MSATLKLEAQKYAALESANQELVARLQQLNIQWQPIQLELETLKTENASLAQRERDVQLQLTGLAERVRTADSANELLQFQITAQTRDEQNRHASELKAATAARMAAEHALADSQTIVNALKVEAEEAAKRSAEAAEIESKHAAELAALRLTLQKVENERAAAQEQLKPIKAEVKQYETELQSLRNQLAESKEATESARKQFRDAQSASDGAAKKRKALIAAHESELSELKRTTALEYTNGLAELKRELESVRLELEKEQELTAQLKRESAAKAAADAADAANATAAIVHASASKRSGRSAAAAPTPGPESTPAHRPSTAIPFTTPHRKHSPVRALFSSVTPARGVLRSAMKGAAPNTGSRSTTHTTVSLAVPLPVQLSADQQKQLSDAGFQSIVSADGKSSVVSAPISLTHTPARSSSSSTANLNAPPSASKLDSKHSLGAGGSMEVIPASPAVGTSSGGDASPQATPFTPGLDLSSLLQAANAAAAANASGDVSADSDALLHETLQRIPTVTLVSNTHNTSYNDYTTHNTTNTTTTTTTNAVSAAAKRRRDSVTRRFFAAVFVVCAILFMFWLELDAAWFDVAYDSYGGVHVLPHTHHLWATPAPPAATEQFYS